MESIAFGALYDLLMEVQDELAIGLSRPLSSGIEATFVLYPPGGYYKRHMDSIQGVDEAGSGRRAVSFLCYLTDPAVEWSRAAGGALRIFDDAKGTHDDLLPTSGSLVLFDSKRVWHEVRPTHRERAALVGWYRNEYNL